MANSAEVRVGITGYIQKKASERLRNTLFEVMPALEFFFGLSGDHEGSVGLGRPKSPIMIGAQTGLAGVTREKIFAERIYYPQVQTTKPAVSEVKMMADYDNTPSVPNWDTTNRPLQRISMPRVKFARPMVGYKVPHTDIRTAKRSAAGGVEAQAVIAIGSVYDLETKTRMGTLMEKLRNQLWGINGEAGYPADEDANQWSSIHSFAAALSDGTNGPGGTYCGVDRSLSQNAYWRGNYITASTPANFGDIINTLNYGSGYEFARYGMGIQLLLMGGPLFIKAKAEAKAENHLILNNGIQEMPEYGFKREVVRIWSGNKPCYCIYDPGCPASTVVALDPSTWTVAIHPDGNFQISAPSDQTKVEGGDEADTGTIVAEPMMVCEVPSKNAIFTAVS